MSDEVLVLEAKRYDFTDKKTGEHVTGVSVWYCYPTPTDDDKDHKGLMLFKESIPLEAFDSLKTVPGFYCLETKKVRDRFGKPADKISGLTFLRETEGGFE